MEALWAFVSDLDNQRTLNWVGGVLVIACSWLWAALRYFARSKSVGGDKPATVISSDQGGIAAGGNVRIDTRQGLSGIELALVVGILIGGLLLALAFAGTRINVLNGVGVGGSVENSTISIERGVAEP